MVRRFYIRRPVGGYDTHIHLGRFALPCLRGLGGVFSRRQDMMAVVARPISVRSWLALLLAICVVPVWIGALYILDRAAQARQELVEAQLLHSARILSLALDDRIAATRSALLSLTSSPALDQGDFRTFYQQSRLLAADFPGAAVILSSRDAQQRVNSLTAFGEPLPKRTTPDKITQVFESGRMVLLPHFLGALTGRSMIGVDIPVMRDGQVVYDLGMSMPCEIFTDILVGANLPPSWIAAYIDDSGTIIGRNIDADKYVGRKAKTPITPGERITQSPTIDGTLTSVAVVGSAKTGWGIAVGVPTAIIESEVAAWRSWMLAGITGLTLFSTAIAWMVGRRIVRAIEDLVPPAIGIGQGLEVTLAPSPILETQEVSDALGRAGTMLRTQRQEVAKRTAELLATNAELDSFAHAVSHDLRAPLRRMNSFSEILIADHAARLDEAGQAYLHKIVRNGEHMGELIDGLLRLSRVTRCSLQRQTVDLSAMAQSLRHDLERLEPGRRVGWEIEDGLVVRGDRNMLDSALRNLVENAWKYTGGTADATIRVYGESIAGTAFICVADNGAGFDMAHAAKLFEPFQRLHRQDEFPGIGIGLSTVRRIIHRHGGTIHAEGTVGKGAVIRFSIPGPEDAIAEAGADPGA